MRRTDRLSPLISYRESAVVWMMHLSLNKKVQSLSDLEALNAHGLK
jgi:hypothetical protein